ncbi:transporter suffix domain-containing protein [Mesobacillus jeotgali]|uniref:Transporter suffix domain-containing protein n=1 Tax=Mesobacillus jeotgali TaxID=129985 RepID=A0ABY9VHU0_9BACI|nr:transporter suffix domain-containing protein [Mesobacillus jeotgali]WNF23420.1 transporter suffix domain-containing protein [Mesobacillus jeotgali]
MMETKSKAAVKPLVYRIGMILIISSFIVWVMPLGIPFLPISGKMKAISITSALVMAEVLFWVGALMVGKEAARKIRTALNPKNWKKKRNADRQDDGERENP